MIDRTSEVIGLYAAGKAYRRGKQEISIFRDLDLSIPVGDFVAIMGPSGSGKTTLLNLLGGTDRVDSGQIHAGGQDITRLSEGRLAAWRARHVGFVFQFYHLMPTLTAAQNIELPLLVNRHSRAARRAKVAAALEIVGLTDRRDHRPAELSGGQQQRVAIARALVSDPQLIMADEPTGDLDRNTADEILGVLRLANDELGKTIVMVTHDQAAAAYATRTLHLDKGVFTDTARDR